MIYWPDELPAPLIGTTYNPVDPQMRTTMQSGRTLARRKFTVVPVRFQARWIFRNDAQAALFEDFYRAVTVDGTDWFAMPLLLPQGRDYRSLRFIGSYSGPKRVNPPGADGDFWEYSAVLELSQRLPEHGPQPPPPSGGVRPPGVADDTQDVTFVFPDGGWVQYASGDYETGFSAPYATEGDFYGGWGFESLVGGGGQIGVYSTGSWASTVAPGSKFYVFFKTVFGPPSGPGFPSITYSASKTAPIFSQVIHGGSGTNYYLFEGVTTSPLGQLYVDVLMAGDWSYVQSVNIIYLGIEPP